MVELKLELGERMLSVSGSLAEVELLAAKFWPDIQANKELSNSRVNVASAHRPVQERSRRTPKARAVGQAPLQSNALAASDLANAIKSRDDFATLRSKFLDVKGQWSDKCRMVAYVAERPISSGDVKRVLEALKVKAELPTISKALSTNASDFLTSGTSPVFYELTALAKTSFEQMLST